MKTFTNRELRMIHNCLNYADGPQGGLPGHNLMLIVAKLIDSAGRDPDMLVKATLPGTAEYMWLPEFGAFEEV